MGSNAMAANQAQLANAAALPMNADQACWMVNAQQLTHAAQLMNAAALTNVATSSRASNMDVSVMHCAGYRLDAVDRLWKSEQDTRVFPDEEIRLNGATWSMSQPAPAVVASPCKPWCGLRFGDKRVPGGLTTAEVFFATPSFSVESLAYCCPQLPGDRKS